MKTTASVPDSLALEEKFRVPLEYIVGHEQQSVVLREVAKVAPEQLDTGLWKPKVVLAHNDLWEGNFLLRPKVSKGDYGFVVIDWAGSCIAGHAIYDLLRLGASMRLRRAALFKELVFHSHILDCQLFDTYGYLLASLGSLGMHLEHFPVERYLALSERCFFDLKRMVVY